MLNNTGISFCEWDFVALAVLVAVVVVILIQRKKHIDRMNKIHATQQK